MIPGRATARSLAGDALLALVSAATFAWLSSVLFGHWQGVMLKWLPNVVAVMLAFHRPRASWAALLVGHAAGLLAVEVMQSHGFRTIHAFHVLADVVETALMIGGLRWLTGDGRLRRSSDIARIGLLVVLLPAALSTLVFGVGLSLVGRDPLAAGPHWFTASVGVATIVLVPWLVARSELRDEPLADLDPKRRALRVALSALLLGLPFVLPLLGYAHDDALVALLVLMASTWLPMRAVAVVFGTMLALHDGDIRSALGLAATGRDPVAWDALRVAAMAMAALYVRLLIAENRSALATTRAASRGLSQAKQALDELALRHRLALTAGGIGVWEADPATGQSDWDTTMFRLFGANEDDGASPRDLMRSRLSPDSIAMAREAMARLRRGDRPPDIADYTLHLPDGTVRRLRSAVARMAKGDGRSTMVGATWDCSMEHLAAEAMRARNDELAAVLEVEALSGIRARGEVAQAQAQQNDLVANVSHELRTPLHAILGFLDLAQEDLSGVDGEDAALARQRIERSQLAAKRLLAQVDDLLDLAKLESGTLALRKRRIDIAQVIAQIGEELAPILKAKQQLIVLTKVGAASSVPPGLALEADEIRMMQVFRNLLANASKFSPPSSVIEVTVRLASDAPSASEWVVDVRDEGPGIPEAELDAVFEKFMQVRGERPKSGSGTGLGLTIARQIARAHGGELTALPCARGAWFRLTIPGHSQS